MSVSNTITVSIMVNKPIDLAFTLFTHANHVKNWYFASDDWHVTATSADVTEGGHFSYTMAAKDGSFSFDFSGIYTTVDRLSKLHITLDDMREVTVNFKTVNGYTEIIETFWPESENTIELQTTGWQAILDNFKKYAENYN